VGNSKDQNLKSEDENGRKEQKALPVIHGNKGDDNLKIFLAIWGKFFYSRFVRNLLVSLKKEVDRCLEIL
jgi:hypothetical protein